MKRFILIISVLLILVSLSIGCYGDDDMNYPGSGESDCEGQQVADELREMREAREAEEEEEEEE